MPPIAPQVLSVGNCGFDHRALAGVLSQQFAARVQPADSAQQALAQMQRERFDLVLVNRRFDLDGANGIDFIRQVKTHPELGGTPVMLISNYPEYQQEAIEAGALPGFGKSSLSAPETLDRLRRALMPSDSA